MKNLNKLFIAPAIVAAAGIIALVVVIGSIYAPQGEFPPVPEDSQIAKQVAQKNPSGITAGMGNSLTANAATIATGTIIAWPDSGFIFIFIFDDHVSVVSDIQAWWSLNSLAPDRGFFMRPIHRQKLPTSQE